MYIAPLPGRPRDGRVRLYKGAHARTDRNGRSKPNDFNNLALAETEGFEPSIGLYKPITV